MDSEMKESISLHIFGSERIFYKKKTVLKATCMKTWSIPLIWWVWKLKEKEYRDTLRERLVTKCKKVVTSGKNLVTLATQWTHVELCIGVLKSNQGLRQMCLSISTFQTFRRLCVRLSIQWYWVWVPLCPLPGFAPWKPWVQIIMISYPCK